MPWCSLGVVSVAVALLLVSAVPNAHHASAASSSQSCIDATADDAARAYQGVYLVDPAQVTAPSPGEGGADSLQFGNLPAVQRLHYENRNLLVAAFLARHAPDYPRTGTGLVGDLESNGPVEMLGRRAGLAAVASYNESGTRVEMMLAIVCDFAGQAVEAHASWKVPLNDFCRALRATPNTQRCSKALLRRAKKNLPRALAKVRIEAPTTVTTSPPTPPTTALKRDGYCPWVGLPCDDALLRTDPDCICGG
jgi:hypothetical protein